MTSSLRYIGLAVIMGLVPVAALAMLKKKETAPERQQPVTANPPFQNLRAFLLMIQYAEGTYGAYAYRMLYGGSLFSDPSRHPNRRITKGGFTSTAAGAYQILYRTWNEVQQVLNLPDFSPISQDRAAIELIRRRGALQDVYAGRFALALYKCRKEWASLPGAGYGQGERSFASLVNVYRQAGGNVLAA